MVSGQIWRLVQFQCCFALALAVAMKCEAAANEEKRGIKTTR